MARHNPIYTNAYRHPEDTGLHIVGREAAAGGLGLADGTFPIGAFEANTVIIAAGVAEVTAYDTGEVLVGTADDPDGIIATGGAEGALVGTVLPADTVLYATLAGATEGSSIVWVQGFVPRTEDPRNKAGV